jgi:DNA-binding CsgD family transcriptional regulator
VTVLSPNFDSSPPPSSGSNEAAMVCRMRNALESLSALKTVDQLVERAPVALCEVGFDRAMISRVHDSDWVVERFYSAVDPRHAAEITEVARTEHERLSPNVIELEMIRRRVPLLVTNVRGERRVSRRLAAMTGSSSYVAAPIAPDGTVVGFLHADRLSGEPVSCFDREVVALFAQEFGRLIEVANRNERFERLRTTVDRMRTSLGGMVSACLDGPLGLVSQKVEDGEAPLLQPISSHDLKGIPEVDRLLSEREREVLRLMALGETNVRIASRLVITEGTVKSHVRHILRKLNAANRAEAVCRWLQRPGTPG